jgi:hypothetical protein
MKIRRGIARLLACVATSAMILVATPLPASANDPVSNFASLLIDVGSNKCFEPTPQDGHFDWAGLPIQQHTCNVVYAFQWYVFVPLGYVLFKEGPPWYCPGCIHLGAEGYFIKNAVTGLCMDARDGATSDGSVVQQWTCRDTNARSMVWYSETGDFPDAFKLRNFNSDLCLDVRWGSSDEYAQLQQYHCTSNNAAQNFWQTVGPSTVMDLNGNWTDGSTRSAIIYERFASITIDMSDFGRPNANGSIVNASTISVTFPDDRKYTGQLQPPNTIRWSNGSIWTKKP